MSVPARSQAVRGRAVRGGAGSSRAARSPAAVAAVAATLALAAVCWAIALGQTRGMEMGVATSLGSLSFFTGMWVPMMAAMMLPGAAPALTRAIGAGRSALLAPLFLVAYLAVWTVAGLAFYAVYRPHSPVLAGSLVIVAGLYELTPLKGRFRRRCHESGRSGTVFGLDCLGSSIGLMAVLLAVGAMSPAWMAAVAALVLLQKLLPARAALDVPVALSILALGLAILLAPGSVPGVRPKTSAMPGQAVPSRATPGQAVPTGAIPGQAVPSRATPGHPTPPAPTHANPMPAQTAGSSSM